MYFEELFSLLLFKMVEGKFLEIMYVYFLLRFVIYGEVGRFYFFPNHGLGGF